MHAHERLDHPVDTFVSDSVVVEDEYPDNETSIFHIFHFRLLGGP